MPRTTTAKPKVAKPAARKPRALSKKKETEETAVVSHEATPREHHVAHEKPATPKGRYVFATGRRKTAVANVRLFSGAGEHAVNKKPLPSYFQYSYHQEEVLKPFQLTGLGSDYYFTSSISGGGAHSQAQALQHGIATALAQVSPEIRKVLKKNGLLTRDDRKKERKKPGLKRARRSPQWAKR